VVYTDRIIELSAIPSTGTVGDSFDNALAEAANSLYKTKLIHQRRPWRTIEQVELTTLEYVWWWNNTRLHSELDMRTPTEVEQTYYADHESAQPALAGQSSRQERKPSRFTLRMDRGLVQPETPPLWHRRRLTTRVRNLPPRRYRGIIQHTTRLHRTGFSSEEDACPMEQ